jgi:hypothetical protein
VAAQFDAVTEATAAFSKLFQKRNWLLGAPVLAGQFVGTFLAVIVVFMAMGPTIIKQITTGSETPDISPFQIGFFIVGFTIAVLFALAINAFVYGWTIAAADPVWTGSDPAFDRGFNRAAATLLQLIAFQLLVFLLVVVSIITIVGPIIIGVLALYGPAYIVLGGRSATQALSDSFKLASENLGETVILVLAFIVVTFCAVIPMLILSFIPVIGLIAQIAIQGLLSGYIALTVVRFYDLLIATAGSPPIPIVPKTSV